MTRLFRAALAVLLLGAVALASSGFGCSMGILSDEQDTEFLVAEVNSLDVPDKIAPSDTLTIHLHGRVGPNGCYSLDRIEEQHTSGLVTVKPIVRHTVSENVGCTSAIVPLDETYEVSPPFESGTLDILVPQPDRPDVMATVVVQE